MSFVAAWNANEALTATVVEEGDFVCSDALNHASIIDSIRLAKAITKCTTAVYPHGDLDDLVAKLKANKGAKRRLIWTDGIFSMEGSIAKLPQLLQIARDHDAVLIVDDSHATGVIGETGRGTPEHFGVLGEVDVITSTLGKALGGAAGGFVAGPAALCDMLTQRARPQLFSNALTADGRGSALAAVRFIEAHPERVRTLHENTRYFRGALVERGPQAARRRDADRPDHHRRDGRRDPDERDAARRGDLHHRLRIPGGAAGNRAAALPGVRRAFAGRSGFRRREHPEGAR